MVSDHQIFQVQFLGGECQSRPTESRPENIGPIQAVDISHFSDSPVPTLMVFSARRLTVHRPGAPANLRRSELDEHCISRALCNIRI
jgi:hypothetical protein